MALWSVSSLDTPTQEREGEGEEGRGGLLAEDVKKLEPIIKFSNLATSADPPTPHCERVRSLAYNRDRYVSL